MAKMLERAYAVYNRKYFSGQLPFVAVKWSEQIEPTSRQHAKRAYGLYTPSVDDTEGAGTIQLASSLKRDMNLWKLTLLHEMCHIKLRNHPAELATAAEEHSKPWVLEMRRLAAAGAFDLLW